MTTTKQYDGQTATFLAAVAQNMPRISGDTMQYWIGNPKELSEVLARAFPEEQAAAQKAKQPCLHFGAMVQLPARADRFDPEKFFKTGTGLYIWDDFTNRILTVAKPVDFVPETQSGAFELAQDSTDEQIRTELPPDHVWENASEFCAYLGGMIERQPDGTSGDLLNNGCANIFYVRGKSGGVFAVCVRWHAERRRWLVRAYCLGGGLWRAGRRVFSRTAAA